MASDEIFNTESLIQTNDKYVGLRMLNDEVVAHYNYSGGVKQYGINIVEFLNTDKVKLLLTEYMQEVDDE